MNCLYGKRRFSSPIWVSSVYATVIDDHDMWEDKVLAHDPIKFKKAQLL